MNNERINSRESITVSHDDLKEGGKQTYFELPDSTRVILYIDANLQTLTWPAAVNAKDFFTQATQVFGKEMSKKVNLFTYTDESSPVTLVDYINIDDIDREKSTLPDDFGVEDIFLDVKTLITPTLISLTWFSSSSNYDRCPQGQIFVTKLDEASLETLLDSTGTVSVVENKTELIAKILDKTQVPIN